MKKILLTFLFLFNFICYADIEVMPYYINSIKRTGIGFTSVSSPLVMKQEPNENSKTMEILNFDYKNLPKCLINNTKCDINDIFVVYKPDKKLAFLSTIDETQDWALICFNQIENPVCGWVKEDKNKYYTWMEFYNDFGRKYGLYLFRDLQKTDKALYSAPVKQTNSVGSLEIPKHITPWLIQGDWMLIKSLDFGNKNKTGWLNYRNNNGKLKVFVNF